MKYILLLLVLCGFSIGAIAQDEKPSALRISLITCSPGAELYSVFGHNALRIVDSAAGTDIAYNFGTFNFDDPDFYTKFVRGKLQYYLSQENFNDFLFAYRYFKRGVSEQVLQLSDKEKKAIQLALFENLSEEHRYYKYDFFYDNCSTRLRDIIFKSKSNQAFTPPPFVEEGLTFRDHLHTYLDRAEMSWTKLGIDIILGLEADKKMSISDAMFLPDFLAKGARATQVNNQKLVSEELVLTPDVQPVPEKVPFWWSPFFMLCVVSIVIVAPLKNINNHVVKLQNIVEKVVFMSAGLVGLLLVFMWVATDHQSTARNLNLIWAFPLHLVFIFRQSNLPQWLKTYAKLYTLLVAILLVSAVLVPGILAQALFPVLLAMGYKTWLYSK
ncbi:MAG: hypothetical protein RL642_81 [Bacteroidota bacterium]|jgi:hypothetical protein